MGVIRAFSGILIRNFPLSSETAPKTGSGGIAGHLREMAFCYFNLHAHLRLSDSFPRHGRTRLPRPSQHRLPVRLFWVSSLPRPREPSPTTHLSSVAELVQAFRVNFLLVCLAAAEVILLELLRVSYFKSGSEFQGLFYADVKINSSERLLECLKPSSTGIYSMFFSSETTRPDPFEKQSICFFFFF